MIKTERAWHAAAVAVGIAALLVAAMTSRASADPIDNTLDFGTAGDVGSASVGAGVLPGWTLPSGVSIDAEVTAAQKFRISNGKMGPFFSHAGYVTPLLATTAGETGVGAVDTFEYAFTAESATGGYQDGLNIAVGAGDASPTGWGRYGGNVFLIHNDNKLKIAGFWLDPALNTGTVPIASPALAWTEKVYAELDPAVAHDIRVVVHFVDGQANDTLDVYVDGALAGTGSTFEGFNQVKGTLPIPVGTLNFFSGANTASTNGIPLIGSGTKVTALTGGGFLFSDVNYSAYDAAIVPGPVPTTPPANIDPTPTPSPDGPLETPTDADQPTPGGTVTIAGSGFDPFENVYFVWYSEPVFAAWAQADADGNVTATIPVPAQFAAGQTHTIQAVGETSGRTLNSTIVIAAAAPAGSPSLPATGTNPVGLALGGFVLVLAGAVAFGFRGRIAARQ